MLKTTIINPLILPTLHSAFLLNISLLNITITANAPNPRKTPHNLLLTFLIFPGNPV